jgi:purine-binding chemotaxis protein CheW
MSEPRAEPARRFDWQGAYARLARAARALEPARSEEEAALVLERRARALAAPLPEPEASRDEIELLVFEAAGETYAIEIASVEAVASLRGLTPVPGTPPAVSGVVAHRGNALPVVDLKPLLGLTGDRSTAGCWLVAIRAERGGIGVRADRIAGVFRAATGGAALSGAPSQQSFVKAVTPAGWAILDVAALVVDARVVVDEEVG